MATVTVSFAVSTSGSDSGSVTGGGLTATPGTVSLTAAYGSISPVSSTVVLTSTSGSALAFNAYAVMTSGSGWLQVSPSTGTAPGTLVVYGYPSGLTYGTFSGTVYVTTAYGQLSIPVTFYVGTSSATGLSVSPTALTFTGQSGGTIASQQLYVSSTTGYTTYFTTNVSTSNWLTISPSNGYTPLTLTVTASAAGLAAGSYTNYIYVIASDGTSQQTIPVTLTVTSSG